MSCELHEKARDWLRRYAPGHYSPDLLDADVERATLRAAQACHALLIALYELIEEAAADLGVQIPTRLPEKDV